MQYRGIFTPNNVNDTFYRTVTVPVGMTVSYDIFGLVAHSAYNVSVRATNQYGVGEFSEEVTVRTEEGGECVALYSRRSSSTDDAACMVLVYALRMYIYRQAQVYGHTHTYTHACMQTHTTPHRQ